MCICVGVLILEEILRPCGIKGNQNEMVEEQIPFKNYDNWRKDISV